MSQFQHHHIKETPVPECGCIDCIMSQPWPPASPPRQQQGRVNLMHAMQDSRSCDEERASTQELVDLLLTRLNGSEGNTRIPADSLPQYDGRFDTTAGTRMKTPQEICDKVLEGTSQETGTACPNSNTRNRSVSYQDNDAREICRYFNSGIDCVYWLAYCMRQHLCSKCNSRDHGAHECTLDSDIFSMHQNSTISHTMATTHTNSSSPGQPFTALEMNSATPPDFTSAANYKNTDSTDDICDDFNNPTGCIRPTCQRRHVCKNCRSPNHILQTCTNYPDNYCDKFNLETGCLWALCQRRHVCNVCYSPSHNAANCPYLAVSV